MQIEIYTPTNTQPLPPIQWNYAEVKAWVEDGLANYKGRVYTEETVSDAKKERAVLNKLAEAIDSKRKEMKATYLSPYELFDKQAKELTAMIKDCSAEIDAQVKNFDEIRKQEKRQKIETELYAPMIGNLAELVPYERLHNPKWLNVTTSVSTISEEMGRAIDRISSGLASIDTLNLAPDIAERVKSVFLKNYDLAAALAERERIEKEREDLARYEAAQREQNARNAADPDAWHNLKPGDKVCFGGDGCVVGTEERPAAQPTAAEQTHDVTFRIRVTTAQLNALGAFMKANNIRPERV